MVKDVSWATPQGPGTIAEEDVLSFCVGDTLGQMQSCFRMGLTLDNYFSSGSQYLHNAHGALRKAQAFEL